MEAKNYFHYKSLVVLEVSRSLYININGYFEDILGIRIPELDVGVSRVQNKGSVNAVINRPETLTTLNQGRLFLIKRVVMVPFIFSINLQHLY